MYVSVTGMAQNSKVILMRISSNQAVNSDDAAVFNSLTVV